MPSTESPLPLRPTATLPEANTTNDSSLSIIRQETFGDKGKINDTPEDQTNNNLNYSDTMIGAGSIVLESPEIKAMLNGFELIDTGAPRGNAPRMTDKLASVKGNSPEEIPEPTPAALPASEGQPAELDKFDPPFTEKFDPEKANSLVESFRSNDFSTRQSAQNEVQKMGPDAIPFLQDKIKQEADGGRDPELMLRSNLAIDSIQSAQKQIQFNQLLQTANKLVPELPKLFAAGGARMDSQGLTATDPMGNLTRFGPMLVVGTPPNKPIDPAQEKAFNKLISDLDAANSNPHLSQIMKELRPEFEAGAIRDKQGTDQYFRLAWLERGGTDARRYLAKGLAESNNPAQQASARQLVAESLERGSKPDSDLRQTALRAGAQDDPAFQKIWKKHSGTNLNDSVLKQRE